MAIHLNDILHFSEEELARVKIRFAVGHENDNPLQLFRDGKKAELSAWLLWNYKKRFFQPDEIAVGLVRLPSSPDHWLLYAVDEITKDLGVFDGVGYESKPLSDYTAFCGRLIVSYHSEARGAMGLVQKAIRLIDKIEVREILPGQYDTDEFPGYENVRLSFSDLESIVRQQKHEWKTALENQKGVYLIVDKSNGKKYVGSAYGGEMLWGRWSSYARTGHGGNKDLRPLGIEHIKAHFQFSILDIFKSTVDDEKIIERESWWKETLLTRGDFGYNRN